MREFSFFSPSSNFEKEFHSRTFLRGYRDILTDFEKTLFQLCNVQYLFVRKLTRPDINNYFYPSYIYIHNKMQTFRKHGFDIIEISRSLDKTISLE